MRRRRRSALRDAVTYTWLGQALLALLPWLADPEISQAVRTGGVGYDRLRPLDAYGYWYARSLGWMVARALPRAALMLVAAASLNERGVNAVLAPTVIVFSGQLLPLNFFPESVQTMLHLQPFAGLIDIPFRIYFADLAGAVALQSLALQAGWTLVLVGFGRFAMDRVMRRLEMQGG